MYRTIAVAIAVTISLAGAAPAAAQNEGNIATVSFGIGLNTAVAPPANGEPNHHVLPKTIRIKQGGVVNFMVAGFHQIYVYKPGIELTDIAVPATGTFVDQLLTDLHYRGILPAGGPPPGIVATANPSNAANRVESVAFLEPGTYLVICNVRVHLNDGMYAYVVVSKGTDKDSKE